MTLTGKQMRFAFDEIVHEMLKTKPVSFTKQELKQAIRDAEAWAGTAAIKNNFNSGLSAGNFKRNATPDEKRLALIFALTAITKG